MLKKNIDRLKRKSRKTWAGLCPKRQKTKNELLVARRKKHKNGIDY